MDDITWKQAIEQTWAVRLPKQKLSTFGLTNIEYFVVTQPIYHEFDTSGQEGVIRTGRVIAEKPKIVTPTYALNLEGFSNYQIFNKGVGEKKEIKIIKYDKKSTILASFKIIQIN